MWEKTARAYFPKQVFLRGKAGRITHLENHAFMRLHKGNGIMDLCTTIVDDTKQIHHMKTSLLKTLMIFFAGLCVVIFVITCQESVKTPAPETNAAIRPVPLP